MVTLEASAVKNAAAISNNAKFKKCCFILFYHIPEFCLVALFNGFVHKHSSSRSAALFLLELQQIKQMPCQFATY